MQGRGPRPASGGLCGTRLRFGAEFLESWHFDRPDCLILDLQMPGLSGTEVQQSLKTAGATFPIVIITAHDSPSLREECMSAGAAEYLCKPLDIQTLVKAVSRVISPKR